MSDVNELINRGGAMKSPYPYFGGKSKVADVIWRRLGDVPVYVEPFFGSGAVWLERPKVDEGHLERLNDLHGFIPNFWRAIQHDPEQVAKWANNPTFECDLHARHLWLVQHKGDLPERLMADPEFYDAKIAGWWVWGACWWIGSGWCSGKGGWTAIEGKLARSDQGRGIARQLMHQGDKGRGIAEYFEQLSARMHRGVSVHCGDWSRLMKPAVAWGLNEKEPTLTGIVLDPPYSHAERDNTLYVEDHDINGEVRQWALDNGSNPNLRIAYCTYWDEDSEKRFSAAGWDAHYWKTNGGYAATASEGRGMKNREREVVWFSPHCVKQVRHVQAGLFDAWERGEG